MNNHIRVWAAVDPGKEEIHLGVVSEACGVHCVDCDVELHVVRIQMGRVRCVDCQEWLVHTEKMRAIRGREE